MNITKFTLENKTVALAITIMLILAGVQSYFRLGRLEDPAFTIKQAVVVTQYPGASAAEVEEEVTNRLEQAVQQMKQLDKVWSISRPGLSTIYVEMQDLYDKHTLPQVWDELRRKMNDIRSSLPPGCGDPLVNDDFGDVYGIFFALHGEGYTMRELYEHAKLLRRELLLCQNVAKIDIWGYNPEVIYLEMSRARISQLGISPEQIFSAIDQENLVGDGGTIEHEGDNLRLKTSGTFRSIEEIGNLLIRGGDGRNPIRLRDILTLRRGYYEPAQALLAYNGQPAIGIGISTVPDTNVVSMGEAVQKRLHELEVMTPAGMQLGEISYESETVKKAVNDFIINLAEAVAIVVFLLLIFMGRHEGVIIGVVLLLTILATFIVMDYYAVTLHRISLGALIIALGMLVDNAIVVAEGIVVKMQRGSSSDLAAVETVEETKWPLLGATFIAVLAFAAISLSKDATGEFLGSLFTVIATSLLISWVLAITITPLLCKMFITRNEAIAKDPHDNRFFRAYAALLRFCLRHRWPVLAGVFVLFLLSLFAFRFVSKEFFPASARPQFMIDCWLREGTHINRTEEVLQQIAQRLRQDKRINEVVTFTGRGALRFILTYNTEMPNSSYGQILAGVRDPEEFAEVIAASEHYLRESYPDVQFNVKRFALGPSAGAKIEARFLGPDPAVLRTLAEQAKTIMLAVQDGQGTVRFIRDDWRQPVQSFNLKIAESRARNSGVSRPQINQALTATFQGVTVGVYRENDELLPIIARPPQSQRAGLNEAHNIMVYSPVSQRAVPITQVTDSLTIDWEDQNIRRRNRQRCITAQCDPVSGVTPDDLLAVLMPKIKAIELPEGYALEWGGDYEKSRDAQTKLLRNIPLAFGLMFIITLLLFGTLRHPVIIFLGLPLAVIGVTWGLLVSGRPFGFMALLGFLSLSGMLIKNEIVLLDQVNLELKAGKEAFSAIVEASISRVRPVSMAAFTTVLGMIPLLFDVFFGPMAVTIMGGLTFATVLTLIVTPVLYAAFYRVHPPKAA